MDVTKYVQDWVAHNDAGDNGFVLSNPSAGIFGYPTNGCMPEYQTKLTVVYFNCPTEQL